MDSISVLVRLQNEANQSMGFGNICSFSNALSGYLSNGLFYGTGEPREAVPGYSQHTFGKKPDAAGRPVYETRLGDQRFDPDICTSLGVVDPLINYIAIEKPDSVDASTLDMYGLSRHDYNFLHQYAKHFVKDYDLTHTRYWETSFGNERAVRSDLIQKENGYKYSVSDLLTLLEKYKKANSNFKIPVGAKCAVEIPDENATDERWNEAFAKFADTVCNRLMR